MDSSGDHHLLTPADSETPSSQRSRSKEHRRSFFRTASHDSNTHPPNVAGHEESTPTPEWTQNMQNTQNSGRKSSEYVGVVEKPSEKGLDTSPHKAGGVRKRLSMLKIGGRKGTKPNGTLRGYVEE